MGKNISKSERQFKYMTFHQSIYAIENDIKKELLSTDLKNKKYSPFGFINHGLCQKCKFLLNEKFDENEAGKAIFDYKDLIKKNVDRDFTKLNKKFSFWFPSDFMFVNKDFFDVLRDYDTEQKYQKSLSTIFNTIIGGDCLIMKDYHDKYDNNPFRYIILYNEIQEEKGNEIDFFLYIKNKEERRATDDYILQNNLWNYFKKIKYDYRDEYKKIYNDYNTEIGYVVRCSSVNEIEYYLVKINSIKQNSFLNNPQNISSVISPQNFPLNNAQSTPKTIPQNLHLNNPLNNQQVNPLANPKSFPPTKPQNFPPTNPQNFPPTKPQNVPPTNPQNNQRRNGNLVQNFGTSKTKNYANLNPEFLLNAAISFLYSIEEIRKYFGQNKNIDFQSFKTIIKTNVGKNIKSMKSYEQIFSELLTKFDNNNMITNEYKSQISQYDEEKGRKNLLDKYKNGNIIQKMFLIPKEEKITCLHCNMNTFLFDYSKYIILKDSQTNLLNKILLGKETESCEKRLCNFCNGLITKLTIERRYLNLPEWLIVIVEPTQINNLIINSFLHIIDKNNIIYILQKFIEDKTNSLYYINTKNNEFCNKFDNIRFYEDEKISSKRPAVLFYYLNKNINNNNFDNNIQNISNNNNNFINSNLANINNNMNQQNIKSNINQQNNFPNVSLSNSSQPNNNQNMIPSQDRQNMNINKGFNENFNSNAMFNQMMNNNFASFNNMNMNNNFINNNGNWMNMQNQNNFFNNNMMNNMFQNNNINNCMNDINIGMNNLNMNMMNNINMQGNFPNNFNRLVDYDNIIVIQFTSTDQKIQRGIKCLPSHKFAEVEEKLYQIYPEYRTTNNSFVTDGRVVIKFQTIAENNIKDGQVVQLIREE